jgi:hypothetical protein
MTNNKQQTAVEWFWNQLPEILPFTVDTETGVKLQEAYQQAKQMEKEQIMQSYSDGIGNGIAVGQEECSFESVADEVKYYEQTYGGNK